MDIAQSLSQIERCRYPSGLYSAVPADSPVKVDIYRSVWIRASSLRIVEHNCVHCHASYRVDSQCCQFHIGTSLLFFFLRSLIHAKSCHRPA